MGTLLIWKNPGTSFRELIRIRDHFRSSAIGETRHPYPDAGHLARGHPDPPRGGPVQLARDARRDPNADADAVRHATAALAVAYHPERGGTEGQMARLNAAYEQAGGP